MPARLTAARVEPTAFLTDTAWSRSIQMPADTMRMPVRRTTAGAEDAPNEEHQAARLGGFGLAPESARLRANVPRVWRSPAASDAALATMSTGNASARTSPTSPRAEPSIEPDVSACISLERKCWTNAASVPGSTTSAAQSPALCTRIAETATSPRARDCSIFLGLGAWGFSLIGPFHGGGAPRPSVEAPRLRTAEGTGAEYRRFLANYWPLSG